MNVPSIIGWPVEVTIARKFTRTLLRKIILISSIWQVDELCINTVQNPEEKDCQQGQEPVTEQVGTSEILPPIDKQSIPKGVEVVQPQTDEPSIAKAGNHAWMAMAIVVTSRLWLGGSVSMHRDKLLIMKLVQQVRNCAKNWNFLVCSDGLSAYPTVFTFVFSWFVYTGRPGRPKRQTAPSLMIIQVIKRHSKGHVVNVVCRVVLGRVDIR